MREIFQWTTIKNGRKKIPKGNKFDPDREFINQAVKDYLNRGGKIKILDDYSKIFEKNYKNDASEFLMGE